jgi:hypothetical protein
MSGRNTLARSLHDAGLAAWFGGSLMGAIGLNGAAAAAKSPQERLRISSIGWGRWTPVQLSAIAAHGIGAVAMLGSDSPRVAAQGESQRNALVKTAVTGLAGAASVASALAGRVQAKHATEPVPGVTEPGDDTPPALSGAQRAQKVLQWTIPALTLVLIVLTAQQGEQQRAPQGFMQRTLGRVRG